MTILIRTFATLLSTICASTALEQQPLTQEHSLSSSIRDSLKDNKIIGDVLNEFDPSFYIDLAYPKYHEKVLLGNDIPVKHVQERPVFVIQAINPSVKLLLENATFTLALTDPDAKSRDNPRWSEMCHWLITNLTVAQLDSEPNESPLVLKVHGELEEYKPPGPPPKTGAHRYVFVLLQGSTDDLTAPKDRKHWGYGKPRHGVRDWAEENELEVVGANFFFAQNKKQ